MKRRPLLAVAAVLVLAVGGCTSGAGGPAGAGGPDDPDPTSWGGRVPPAVLDCGTPAPGEERLSLPEVNVAAATWSTPSGFALASGYFEDWNVESVDTNWVAEPVNPSQPSLNVLGISLYSDLDWSDQYTGCQSVPLEAIVHRLESYGEHMQAQPLSDAEIVELAGYPAVTRSYDVTGSNYQMQGWWLFTATDLLFLSCQWTSSTYQARIMAGCDEVRASLVVPR